MSQSTPDPVTGTPEAPHRAGVWRRLLRKPLGAGSIVLLGVIVLLGILAPLLSPHDPNHSALDFVNAPVGSGDYLLGADKSGRDIWARLLASINVSLISAVIGAGVAVSVGTAFGLVSGFAGKRVDLVLSGVFNLMMTFPALVLIIVLTPLTDGAYQPTMAIFGLFLAPGIFRLVRNLVAGVRNELYVDAARVAGLSNLRILSRHVLFVVRGPIVIAAAFLAGTSIGVQAGLVFLGVGSNQDASFGGMTSDAFANIYAEPVQFLWPSLGLALITGSFVLLGNALRDALFEAPGARRTRRRWRPRTKARQDPAPVVPPEPTGTPADEEAEDDGRGTALLRVRNVRVAYPSGDGALTPVVRGVSLTVRRGEVVGLVGESGSGKTQTAFAVLGLLPHHAVVSADAIAFDGRPLLGLGRSRMRALRGGGIAYVPQEPMSNLDPSFTVGTQLVQGMRAALGISRREARETARDLLARVGIPDPERTFRAYPHQISGGMAQRVLIAGAVSTRPRLLIADEPTTALDVTVQAEILDLLRSLQSETDMGLLLVTHNFGVVADICDRVVVMRDGTVAEEGSVPDVFDRPRHPYTRTLLDAILDETKLRDDPPAAASAREAARG